MSKNFEFIKQKILCGKKEAQCCHCESEHTLHAALAGLSLNGK